ncbi:uncharacterized protein MONBRDRAFT_34161 [Monosiga brevicollis MX1]|uniref:Myosin motor domain-containing protein n=1 Tax=Monosiga brevicollis TaxID=81824 RepID=A9V9Y7_MONBE|nr:uncharacterized protein MONBRDRAFT_34161 [Monosiga brevicollis MX1]EDQ85639.1 predicted protein [Monosiga brevicollis MX1]|eukprot:XP_001749588.1 hypothetical protein [Monosiga brevicollis MX1]
MAGSGTTAVGAVDDLATLTTLDNDLLLEHLHQRYEKDVIYTYVGDILIAINPFKELGIYDAAHKAEYQQGNPKLQHTPHIFAVADTAYHDMLKTGKDQCCVISGESGAGKTESAKFVISHIIDLCRAGDLGSKLEQRILQMNPLLEAFGNASTFLNDNSSRFGKYTELLFNPQGQVMGARLSEYLLEKSRVVHQMVEDKNFHVFYYLFASAERDLLGLDTPATFPYLNQGSIPSDAHQQLELVHQALDDIGFTREEQSMLQHVLAAVLHTGRINFKSADHLEPAHFADGAEGVLAQVAKLLKVDQAALHEALMASNVITRGEAIRKPFTLEQAEDTRDAMAKALYGRMFGWIVSGINGLLKPDLPGILDIFGFEIHAESGFEQFCINLANEQLQHFFNQQEYARQGVDGANVTYVDNGPVLDMFLSRPVGLLALLDEESHFPKATDETLVLKFALQFKDYKAFVPAQGADCSFTVRHYAEDVQYTGYGFLYKNRDSMAPDVSAVLQTSGLSVVAESFLAEVSSTGQILADRARWGANAGRRRQKDYMPGAGKKTMNTTNKRALTVSGQFRNSLFLLVEKMTACSPHFVRCIKPSKTKNANFFDPSYVMAQLKYTGMLETTRIRREGYSFRPSFEEFLERRTKVFLKYFQAEALDEKVQQFQKHAASLQKVAKGFLARRHVQQMNEQKRKQEAATASFFATVDKSMLRQLEILQRLSDADAAAGPERFVPKSPPKPATPPPISAPAPSPAPAPESKVVASLIAEPPSATAAARPRIAEAQAQPSREELAVAGLLKQKKPEKVKPIKVKLDPKVKAAVKWWRKNERRRGAGQKPSGHFHDWFHGVITRREAEDLLAPKPIGCFLTRISETRLGYTLSVRTRHACKHFVIEETRESPSRYMLQGRDVYFDTLERLIEHYRGHPANDQGDHLTVPCGQPLGRPADYLLLLS